MRKILGLACALGFSAMSVPAQESQEASPTRPAKVFTVAEQSDSIVRRYPGIVFASQEVELSFRIGGTLTALPIRGSQAVVEGDVIGQLDVRDFETQGAQLQSQLDQALANLDILREGARPEEITALEAAVEAARAQVDQARDQVERTRTLAARGTVSQAQLDRDEAAFRVAEAALRAEIESLAIGQQGGRPQEIAVAEAAIRGIEAQLQAVQNNINDATLRAPFDGIIARRNVENFANVQAGQSIALLQALDVVHVHFDVPAPDVTALTVQGVDNIRNAVEFNALPGEIYDAETVEFSIQADSATQTYLGRVAVDVRQGSFILPGMVGTVIASAPATAPALTVPLSAVGSDKSGTPLVWLVQDGNIATPRTVTLGDIVGDHVVVLDGLQSGDRIISAGIHALLPGMEVRPVTEIGG